ncbi:MAG: ADP-ribosylglycohydrolase family protein [Chloroflexi bacterium]|nr:ADP-ribosylglycohydrolase family protein [Chloroflexota bacterium]
MSFLPVLYGLALGDALGRPVEFMTLDSIRARYGPRGIAEPPDPALFTDDTQMTLALAQALVCVENDDTDQLMEAVVAQFIAWAHHPDTPGRSPGATCLRAVAALERGVHWRESGVKGSKGCGSAMRVAPIGYLYQHSPERLRAVAQATGRATHAHPAADAACIAAAYLVKLALDGAHPKQFSRGVLEFCDGLSDEFDAAILRLNHTLGWADTDAALRHIGEGWVGEEAVALAIYCCLKHPDDYVAAVRLGANITGDSDSVASIAGGIMGARLGRAAIPADWIVRLERRAELETLAERLTYAQTHPPL